MLLQHPLAEGERRAQGLVAGTLRKGGGSYGCRSASASRTWRQKEACASAIRSTKSSSAQETFSRRWYRGRFDSTVRAIACASRLRARSTRLDVVADELNRRAVDAAAVLLDLVVADRRHVDAALLELLGRAGIAVAHEHAPRLEDERVDRPELVG